MADIGAAPAAARFAFWVGVAESNLGALMCLAFTHCPFRACLPSGEARRTK